ncbi:MAG: hypothetical protein MJ153_04375 [Clostridia bacterium]|nr:hypothetical protein [Clostridia bacterium]
MEQYSRGSSIGLLIAYCGIEGSFASQATARLLPGARRIGYPTFEEAYDAVKNDECEAALLPLENNYAGEIGAVIDLMFTGKLCVAGVFKFEVNQCLLGVPGSTRQSIKRVLSHPQAIEQCTKYLRKNKIEAIPYSNTATAARRAAQHGSLAFGAIASAETAKLYGLEILDADINDNSDNITKFVLLTKGDGVCCNYVSKKSDINIIMFTVDNSPGSLAQVLFIPGIYGYNLRVIRSRSCLKFRNRPNIGQDWEYYFYVEIEGDLFSDEGKEMIKTMTKTCRSFKIVGKY